MRAQDRPATSVNSPTWKSYDDFSPSAKFPVRLGLFRVPTTRAKAS